MEKSFYRLMGLVVSALTLFIALQIGTVILTYRINHNTRPTKDSVVVIDDYPMLITDTVK